MDGTNKNVLRAPWSSYMGDHGVNMGHRHAAGIHAERAY